MNNIFDKICVVGLGYIGLPTAAVFADHGIKVVGVDVSQHAVDTINTGKAHIIEPDLDALLKRVVEKGMLKAQTQAETADAYVIAVPTPFKGEYEPDLRYIESATRALAPVVKEGDLLVLESTVPPGATEKMVAWLEEERPDLKGAGGVGQAYYAAHCPERVLPGRVLIELIENDRLIGGITEECSARAQALYKTFVKSECVITNARTAELAKLTENSFRDVNIAFANELSIIADKLEIDVWELISLANRHPRVNILQPGAGVGGHCIAVDPWFIVDAAPKEARLIHTARLVNDGKPKWVFEKIMSSVKSLQKDKPVVACFGIAFKPDIDDLRESPALSIVEELCALQEVDVLVVEPNVSELPKSLVNAAKLVSSDEALQLADVSVLLVGHKEFKSLTQEKLEDSIVVRAYSG